MVECNTVCIVTCGLSCAAACGSTGGTALLVSSAIAFGVANVSLQAVGN